ncbi:hypothetical protein CTI14_16205, partial [Methylobacterium radiotolerans]
ILAGVLAGVLGTVPVVGRTRERTSRTEPTEATGEPTVDTQTIPAEPTTFFAKSHTAPARP